MREVNLLCQNDMPNVPKLICSFDDDEGIYLVFEICSFGDFSRDVATEQPLKEKEIVN